MISYVCGFAFDKKMEKVALLKKQLPAWQHNWLNGVGGKIESGERPIDAMVREFKEETGVATTPAHWHPLLLLSDPGKKVHDWEWEVYFFWATLYDITAVKTVSWEEVWIIDVNKIWSQETKVPTLPNLQWLIGMAVDQSKKQFFTV